MSPKDPSAPFEEFPERRGTGTYLVRDLTPVQELPFPQTPPPRRGMSTGTVGLISGALGIIIAASVILGGLGKAFFVTREEHNNQITSYSNDKSDIQRSLTKLEGTLFNQNVALEKQGQSIERMLDKIQAIREDMARRNRR